MSFLTICLAPLALRSQSEIGWHQAIKGYLSQQWTTLVSHSMDTHSRPDSNVARRRIRSILRGIHAHTRRIWLHRNSILHSSEVEALANICSQEIAEIKYYHANPHLLLSTDQHHCTRSLSRATPLFLLRYTLTMAGFELSNAPLRN